MPLVTTLYYCCFYHYTESEVRLRPDLRLNQTLDQDQDH